MDAFPADRGRSARRRRAAAAIAALASTGAAFAIGTSPVPAVSLPERTLRASTDLTLGDADGASQNPSLSVDGRSLAFETTATDVVPDDLNGAISDIVAIDLVSGVRRNVSETGDGPSVTPSVSGDGRVVAFVSYATNLFANDVNGQPDVLVRNGRGPVVPVSLAADGGPADGPSYQPEISNDGRYVVFTSEATNLVAGDANGRPDVFLRDLATGKTELISRTAAGAAGAGRSSQPAVSSDGRYVAFESAAADLVTKDTNGIADVFVRDRQTGKTERVSVSSGGVQQDKAVPPPFTIAPDISRDGRYVVFESDATSLVSRDGNKRTDIFLRDRKAGTTRIVSASSYNVQGNNDSFNPRLSANGRFLAFQSFATNLVRAGDDGPREDVFVRDLVEGTTTVATVTNTGSPRQPEVTQFLQRPTISNDARVAAFASTVGNLVAGDGNETADVFVRRLDPPETRLVRKATSKRRSVVVAADDPRATRFVCRVDENNPFDCGSTVSLRRTGGSMSIRATGPGLLVDPDGIQIRISNDRRRPSVRIAQPRGHSLRTVRGVASDRGGSGLSRVEVSVTYLADRAGHCNAFDGRRMVRVKCTARRFVRATGRRSWRLRLSKSIRGPISIVARAVDGAGNRSASVRKLVVLL